MPDTRTAPRPRAADLVRASCAALAVLFALASAASAQEGPAPRVKRSPTREDRAAWRGVLAWPEACEAGYAAAYSEDEEFGGLAFHPLGRGRYLVEVTCDGGGVQPGSVFMLYDDRRRPRRARALKLKGFESEDEAGRPLPYSEVRALTQFRARTRELMLMSKMDAMGTCGLYVRYSFAGGRPRVVEARRNNDCGGPRGTPDVTRWPRVRL